MGFLEKLSEMIAPASKQFEQNVNKAPMGNPMPYHDGMSAEDMYRLQMANEAMRVNDARKQGLAGQFEQNADKFYNPNRPDAGINEADLYELHKQEQARRAADNFNGNVLGTGYPR